MSYLGYADPRYCASLREFGEPRHLAQSGGWVLVRDIAGRGSRDVTGCYPLFCAPTWDGLGDDIDALRDDFVSLVLVTDPFGEVDRDDLTRRPGVRLVPWKDHFVIDFAIAPERLGDENRRRNALKAARSVRLEEIDDPTSLADVWVRLYGNLVHRFGASGMHAPTSDALMAQLAIPGATLLVAYHGDEVVQAQLYLRAGDVAYLHLVGVTPEAYGLNAGAALTRFSIERLRDRVSVLDLGGGAGLDPAVDDGLTSFKRAWSTSTLPTWLVCVVLDDGRYAELVASGSDPHYFPAYRSPDIVSAEGSR